MTFTLRALLLLALFPGHLLAQQGEREPMREAMREAAQPLERSELPESVLRIERQTGGEVLRAERMQRDGREVYRLKVLTPDGRVRIMREDPRERRRDAWRDSRGTNDISDRSSNDNGDVGQSPEAIPERRLEPRLEPTSPPSDLAMPETLPPLERGDQQLN